MSFILFSTLRICIEYFWLFFLDFLILIDKFASIDSIDFFSFQFKYSFLLIFVLVLYYNIKELEIRILVQ